MAQGTVTVSIVGDASRLKSALGESESALAKFSGKMQSVGKSIMGVGSKMTLGITAPIALMAGKVIQDLGRIETINAQTAAAITSTGGAANVTAAHVEGLAGSIEKLTGREAEATQEAANLLLTFTNVANQVGEGNNIFDRATMTVQDMAVALGTDGSSAALMLGKALNDPIAGMTSLGRAGIQFTAEQKKTIKEMVATGDTLGAQKLILAELDKQVGGSADAWGKTLPGQLAKAKHSMGEVAESLAKALLPAIQTVAEFVQKLAARFQEMSPRMQKLVGIGILVAAALGPLVTIIGALVTVIGLLISPVGLVILGLAALVAGVIYAYQNFETFRETVDNVLATVKTAITAFVAAVSAAWRLFGDDILRVMEGVWTTIRGVVEGALQVISGIIAVVTGIIHGDWAMVWDGIKQIFQGVWDAIVGILSGFVQTVLGIFGGMFDALRSAFGDGLTAISQWFRNLPANILNALGNVAGILYNAGRDLVGGFIRGINDMIPNIPSLGSVLPGFDEIFHRASGGPLGPGQWSWVGENGPELIKTGSQGAHVFSASESRRMIGGGSPAAAGGSQRPEIIIVQVDGREIARAVRNHDRSLL